MHAGIVVPCKILAKEQQQVLHHLLFHTIHRHENILHRQTLADAGVHSRIIGRYAYDTLWLPAGHSPDIPGILPGIRNNASCLLQQSSRFRTGLLPEPILEKGKDHSLFFRCLQQRPLQQSRMSLMHCHTEQIPLIHHPDIRGEYFLDHLLQTVIPHPGKRNPTFPA